MTSVRHDGRAGLAVAVSAVSLIVGSRKYYWSAALLLPWAGLRRPMARGWCVATFYWHDCHALVYCGISGIKTTLLMDSCFLLAILLCCSVGLRRHTSSGGVEAKAAWKGVLSIWSRAHCSRDAAMVMPAAAERCVNYANLTLCAWRGRMHCHVAYWCPVYTKQWATSESGFCLYGIIVSHSL